jgi:uncharacterized protein YeaO (DUF488 family)
MANNLAVKRVYAPAAAEDGFRVLVDRLWPRGLSKASAHIDLWARDVAPSDALRQWFGHEPSKWDEFRQHYAQELAQPDKAAALAALRQALAGQPRATLLFAAHDEAHNNAVALLPHLRAGRQ